MDAQGIPANGEIITDADDRSLHVRFYTFAVQNGLKSTEEGRPIYDDKDFIEVRIPGDRNTVIKREVMDEDKGRFPNAWSRYKAGMGEKLVGTPIDRWGILQPSQIEELRALNMPTVELVAACGDGHVGKFMGLLALRKKACEFIESTKNAGAVASLQSKLAERDDKIATLTEQVQTLAAAVEAMQEASPEAAAAAVRSKKAPKVAAAA